MVKIEARRSDEHTRPEAYRTDSVTLYCGDCRDILPTLEKWSMDLVVTDPPYGIGYQSNYRTGEQLSTMSYDDGSLDMPVILAAMARVLRRWRHLYVFGPFEPPPPFTANAQIVWAKTEASGRGDMTIPWGKTHETINFAVRAADRGEVSARRGNGAAKLRQGTVIECPVTARGKMRHPTEKPVMLLRRLIEASSLLGDVVLDPFAGAGSTLVAAALEGRRAVGIEVNPHYCDVAVERLRAVDRHLAQLDAVT
jgi:DNA modification methylase